MMNKTHRNIIANYGGTFIQFVGQIGSLPVYLSLLGPAQFGLVSLVATLQAALGLLEAGFAQVSAKEFSVLTNSTARDYDSVAYYMRRFERIFWGIAIAAGLVTAFMSAFLVEHWLVTNTELEKELAVYAVLGAAFIFTLQFPGALYRSFLVGSQQQVKLNVINSTGVFVRHGGGIVVLWLHPTLYTYLFWMAFSYGLETLARRIASWKSIHAFPRTLNSKKQNFRRVIKDSLKMFAAILVGTITTQLDKIILSGFIPIEQFGYYAIASTVSIGVISAIQPVIQAMSPLIMQSGKNPEALRLHSVKLAKIITIIVAVFAVSYIFFGYASLAVWLRNVEATEYIFPILSILLVGSALNAYYHIGYYNWLARAQARNIFVVNMFSLLATVIVTPFLIRSVGVLGATFGFVTMNLIGMVFSLGWLKKQ